MGKGCTGQMWMKTSAWKGCSTAFRHIGHKRQSIAAMFAAGNHLTNGWSGPVAKAAAQPHRVKRLLLQRTEKVPGVFS